MTTLSVFVIIIGQGKEMNKELLNAETEEEKTAPEGGLSGEVTDIADEPQKGDVTAGGETQEEGVEETDAGVLGENLVGEFSFHIAARAMGKVMRVPEKVISYMVSFVYLVVGVLCVSLTQHIEAYLPYIVGSLMSAFAVAQFVIAIIGKEYKNPKGSKVASPLIILLLGIFILVEHEWGHTFIPVLWGLFGLYEGAQAFNHAVSRIARGLNPAYFIIKGVIEVGVAFLLLYKPEEYAELHIIVFGISLIFDGITHMPPIKKLLTGR